ncbi:hypothetical protein KBX10_03865 [Corynebacterium sp. CCUG 59401]|nr:hypothetical protein [Corynebacterium pseudogenitalium]
MSYSNGSEEKTRPVEDIARITQEPMSGSLIFEFTDGTSDYVENGGDEQGVSEFVGKAQQYLGT